MEENSMQKTGLAHKLFILRTREVGRFALWGITKFSSDSQPSSFFFPPFIKARVTRWKEQQWNLKPRKENIASSYSHNLWNLWPEKTLLKLAVPSLNWAQCSGIHITTFCFSILTEQAIKNLTQRHHIF